MARPRMDMVISSVMPSTMITMNRAELVNETSIPPISIGTSRLISNCARGL